MPQTDIERHVTIEVNHIHVRISGDDATGLEIKQAAIAQGVHIELDFVLSVKRGDKWVVVGDAEPLELKNGDQFDATADDDNS